MPQNGKGLSATSATIIAAILGAAVAIGIAVYHHQDQASKQTSDHAAIVLDPDQEFIGDIHALYTTVKGSGWLGDSAVALYFDDKSASSDDFRKNSIVLNGSFNEFLRTSFLMKELVPIR
jgi:succinate dehydrogenase/fumarate reductase flavoprotein subunit